MDINKTKEKFVAIDSSGCWIWIGFTNQRGYGRYRINGRTWVAHRLFYTMYKNEIPDNLVIDHLCKVRNCVNPEHLEAVTQQENVSRGDSGRYFKSKTHCPKGHEYDEKNTRLYNGRRYCRICDKERKRIKRSSFST